MLANNLFGKSFLLVLLVLVLGLTDAEEDKWVWRGGNDRNGRKASPRYEIYEDNFESDNGYGPIRPIQGDLNGINRPGLYNPQRPTGIYGQGRPPFRPDIDDYEHNNNFGLGGNNPDVLVGPSYGKGPFLDINSCGCTERFNCKGLAYGSCDVGKQYCCTGKSSGLPPSRPVHSAENGILVGPGHSHNRPSYYPNRPSHLEGNRPYAPDVLVGPGGPTGLIGRPQGHTSGYGAENGVLVGPGGPHDRPYSGHTSGYGAENGVLVGPGGPQDRPYPGVFPYARSAGKKD